MICLKRHGHNLGEVLRYVISADYQKRLVGKINFDQIRAPFKQLINNFKET